MMKPFIHEPVGPYVDIDTGEHLKPNAEDENVIVSVALDRCLVIGCKPYPCMGCGLTVGLSPSSQAVLEQAPKSKIMCLTCVLKLHEEEPS